MNKLQKIKYPDWKKDDERLVLFVDIMGFSNRVMCNSHRTVKENLLKFKEGWEKKMKPLLTGNYLAFSQFSDSIIVVARGTDSKMFNLLSKAAVCIMQLALENAIPLKGVIAKGEFTFDKDAQLYFGKPLVEAYQLHDELHFYGIVVHHSAEGIIKQFADDSNPYSNSPIFIKGGKTCHYHLEWYLLTKLLAPGNITETAQKWLEKIAEQVSGKPRIYIDNTITSMQIDAKAYRDNHGTKDMSAEA